VGRLIELYHEEQDGFTKVEIAFHIFLHIRYIAHNLKKPDKLGGSLTEEQSQAIKGLYDLLGKNLADFLSAKDRAAFDQSVVEYFGRGVGQEGKAEDLPRAENDTMQYYKNAAERRKFKLSFRNGVAYQTELDGGSGTRKLVVYDTDARGDAIEHGGSLYVMDGKGHLYVSGKEEEKLLKHSSFLAGEPTLAAGTIRFAKGQLVWISGKSGHYKPTVAQMVTALERLAGYGVKLDKVIVYRENYKEAFRSANPRFFEPCTAKELLKARAWPNDPDHAKAMFVDK